MEYDIARAGNSGVMYHVTEDGKSPGWIGPEVQILDNKEGEDRQKAGWFYQLYKPDVDATHPAGQWNQLRILVTPAKCTTHMNGVKYYEYVKGSKDWDERVARSKFAEIPRWGKATRGYIALQDHGGRVAFRNVKIRPIAAAGAKACIGDGGYIHQRGGCPNAFHRCRESQKTAAYTKITFFGGSITEGAGASKPENCYRELTMRQLRQDYPGAVLAENNSAIGGTGSWLGAFRTSERRPVRRGGAGLRRVCRQRRRRPRAAGLRVDGRHRAADLRPRSVDRRGLPLHAGQEPHGRLPAGQAAGPRGLAREDRRALRHPQRQPGPVCGRENPQGRAHLRRVRQGRRASDRPRLCHSIWRPCGRSWPAARRRPAAASPVRHAMPKAFQPRADGARPVRALSTGKARRRLEDRPTEPRRPLHARAAKRSARRHAHAAFPGRPGRIFRRHRPRFVRFRGLARRRPVETAARFRFLLRAVHAAPRPGRSPPGWTRRSGTNCGCASPRSSRPRARAAWRGSAGCWSTAGSRIRSSGLAPLATDRRRFTPPWTP